LNIDIERVNPFLLPSVPVEKRSDLPDIAAIYFALSETGKVLYVGKAPYLRKRWISYHHQLASLETFPYVRITWLAVGHIAPHRFLALEGRFIDRFAPMLKEAKVLESGPADVSYLSTPEWQAAMKEAENPCGTIVERQGRT